MRSTSPTTRQPVRSRLENLKNYQYQQPSALDLQIQVTQPSIPEKPTTKDSKNLLTPPHSLLNRTSSCIYPTETPILTAERNWLGNNINQLLQQQNLLTKSSMLKAFQYMHELARHYYNVHHLPIVNGNPVFDLVVAQLKLSEKLYQELSLHNFDPDQEERTFKNEKEMFELQQKVKDLESQAGINKQQWQFYENKLSQALFDNQELNKKYTAEYTKNRHLNEQIKQLQEKVDTLQLKIDYGNLNRGQSMLNVIDNDYESHISSTMNMTRQLPPMRPKSAVFNISQQQREVLSPMREPINEEKQKSQVESKLNFTARLSSKPGQESTLISAVQSQNTQAQSSIDKIIDHIPPVSRVDTTRRCVSQQGFSRLKKASDEVDKENIGEAAKLTDCYQYGDNIVENKYNFSDIARLDEVEYNQITKEVILKKNNIQEQAIQQATTRLIDCFNKPTEDSAWIIEQAVLRDEIDDISAIVQVKRQGNELTEGNGNDNIDDEDIINFQIKQPAKFIEEHLNPFVNIIENAESNAIFHISQGQLPKEGLLMPKRQPEIDHPRYISKMDTVLKTIWAVGSVQYCEELINTLTLKDNSKIIQLQREQLLKKQIMHKITPVDVYSDYQQQELLFNDNDVEMIIPQLITNYFKTGTREPMSIFTLIAYYTRTVVATSKQVQYNYIGIRTKPQTSISKLIDITQFMQCLQDKEFQKSYQDNVIKNFTFYKLVSQNKQTTEELHKIINQLNPRTFGFEKIKKQIQTKGYKLYDIQELLSEFNHLILARQAQSQSQLQYNQRKHAMFSLCLYNILLQRNQYQKNLADKHLISLSFSCLFWSTYLSIIDNYLRPKYITIKPAEFQYLDRINIELNGMQPHLPFLFLLLLNDFFSPQDTEFLLFAYQKIIGCVRTNQLQIYGYIDAATAGIAIGQIFSLQNLDIKMGVEKQVALMQDQVISKSHCIGEYKLIDIGKLLQIILKGREAILSYYQYTIFKKLEECYPPQEQSKKTSKGGKQAAAKSIINMDLVITVENYKEVLICLNSEISNNPLLDTYVHRLFEQLCLQNQQPTLKELLLHTENYMLNYGYIYDIICSYIPLYQMNRLIYQNIIKTKVDQKQANKNVIQIANTVSNLLINQGNGLSYLGQPIKFNNCKIVAEKNYNLVEIGYIIQDLVHTYQQNYNIYNLRQVLVQVVNGCLNLKYFQFEQNSNQISDMICETLNDFLQKNVNIQFEKESMMGLKFTEQVGIEQLLMLVDNRFWEVK